MPPKLVAKAIAVCLLWTVAALVFFGGTAGAANSVVAWGANQSGQANVPENLTNTVAVAGGSLHSLALQADGRVAAWGNNAYGQATVPTGLSDVTAIAAGNHHNLALRRDGRVVAWGHGAFGQTNVPPGLTNAVAIAAGTWHNLAVRNDGTVLAWGRGSSLGETNVPPGLSNVVAVAAGAFFSLALKADGTVAGWGATNQATVPANLTGGTAIAARGSHSMALRSDGTVAAWGSSSGGLGNVPPNLTNAVAIACGFSHNLVLTSEGVIVAWGENSMGQTGVPAVQGYVIGLAAGDSHNISIVDRPLVILAPPEDQTVLALSNATFRVVVVGSGPFTYQWQKQGTNLVGDAHVHGSQTATLTISNVLPRDAGTYSVTVHNAFDNAITSEAVLAVVPVVAWGRSFEGQTAIPLSLTNVLAVAAGRYHNLALKQDGTVLAWGWNESGETSVPQGLSNVIAVTAGGAHSAALRSNGTVAVWGNNIYGQRNVPMGLTNVVSIAAGVNHTLALRTDGRVISWGTQPTVPPNVSNVVGIAAGEYHSLALRADGTVVAWGSNPFGQTNVPAGLNDAVAIASGPAHSLALRANGTVVTWGSNSSGQRNVPTGLTGVVAIAAGAFHSLALTVGGRVVAWGQNQFGSTDIPLGLPTVAAIAAGYSHNLTLLGTIVTRDSVLARAVDAVDLDWSTRGDDVWFSQTPITHDGVDALQSGRIDDDQKSILETSITGPGILNFWWKVSCEGGYDFLNFVLDGIERSYIDGEIDWAKASIYIPPGRHSAGWAYTKDGSETEGGDAGWLDQVSFVPGPSLPPTFVPWGDWHPWHTPPPAVLYELTNIIALAAGRDHSLALRNDGRVVAWGENTYGQIDVPSDLTNVIAISASLGEQYCWWQCGVHNLALKVDGTVVAWGWNGSGQTNVPVGLSNVIAVAAGGAYSLALRADGRVVGWGSGYDGKTVVPGLTNVVAIAVGNWQNLALQEDGSVVAWGGWTNLPAGLTDIIAVAAGRDHSLALSANGTVVAWGTQNSAGQTNIPTGLLNVVAIAAGAYHSLALTTNGRITAWGDNWAGQSSVPVGLSNVVAIAAGLSHSLAAVGDGSPSIVEHPSARIVSGNQATRFRVRAVGRLPLRYQWRHNGIDILHQTNAFLILPDVKASDSGTYSVVVSNALGSTVSRGATLRVLEGPLFIVQPTNEVSFLHGPATLTMTVDGQAPFTYQWQFNGVDLAGATNAELRLSNLSFAESGNYAVVVSNHFGSAISEAAVLSVVPVIAWGTYYDGSSYAPIGVPPDLTNVIGVTPPYAILPDGKITKWSSQMHPRWAVPVGLSNVVAIETLSDSNLTLRSDGTVVAWGAGGQITAFTNLSEIIAIAGHLALTSDGRVVPAVGVSDAPQSLSNVVAIGAGYYHKLALKGDGTLTAWGGDYSGQASVPPGLVDVVEIAAGYNHSLALKADGTVISWGSQSNIPAGLANVVAIAAGTTHSVALKSDGTIVAWGGRTSVPPGITNAVQIAAGDVHAVALVGYGPPNLLGDQRTIRTAFSGRTHFIHSRATGALPLSYRWQRNHIDISGATNRLLILTNPQSADNGVYSVIVSNAFGTAASAGTVLTLVQSAPFILRQPLNQVQFLYGPATLEVRADGSGPLQYQWRFNGGDIPGATNAVLELDRLAHRLSGDYSVVVSNPFGSTISADAKLSLVSVVGFGEIGYGVLSLPTNLEDIVAIAAKGYHSIALRADGTVVAWGWSHFYDAMSLNGLQNAVAVAAGTYHNLVLKIDGTVVDGAGPVPGVTNAVAIAAGRSINVAVTADGSLVAWGPGGGGATVLPPGLSNVVAIAAGEEHVLALRENGTVTAWGSSYYGQTSVPQDLTNVVSIAAGQEHSLALLQDGSVRAWGGNSAGQTTLPADLTNAVAIAAGPYCSLAIKADGTVSGWGAIWEFTGEGVPYRTALTLPGDISHVVSATAGFAHALLLLGEHTVTIPTVVEGSPSITVEPLSRTFHAGETIQLWTMAAGRGTLMFQWQLNGTNVVGATNRVFALANAQLDRAGVYTVVVSNAGGVVTSRVARVTILQRPQVGELPPETLAAAGSSVTVSIEATGTPPLRYQWRKNGVNIAGATNSTYMISNVQLSDGGSYSVVVANDVGVAVSDPTLLIVEVPIEPPGDDFVNRVTIVGLTNAIGGTNRWATSEPGEPLHAGKSGSNSVWYTWQAPTNGIATFRTVGSTFDTLLGVYTGDDVWALQSVAQDEDRGGYLTSQLRFNAKAGTYYHIAIDGFAGQQGTFILSWDLEPTTEELPVISREPAGIVALLNQEVTFSVSASGTNLTYQWFFNDVALAGKTNSTLTISNAGIADVGIYAVHLVNALGRKAESLPAPLQLGSQRHPLTQDKWEDLLPLFGAPGPAPKPSGGTLASPIQVRVGSIDYQIFDTRTSQGSITDPTPCDVIGGASAWQAFRPVENGVLVIDTQGSTFNTVLVLYSLGDNLTTLREVACNNNAGPGQTWSYIRANVRAGDDYLAVVDGVNGTRGKAALNWRMGLPPARPNVVLSSNFVHRGANLILNVNATDRFPLFFQWLRNGWMIPGAINQTLSLAEVDAIHAGRYTLLVQNWFGTVTNDVAQVTVEVPYLKAEYMTSNRLFRIWLPEFPDRPLVLQTSPDLINWTPLETYPTSLDPFPYRDFAITNRLFFRTMPWP